MKTGGSSFRALFGADHRVVIPVIQRDYAQGRDDEHSQEVRRRFLDSIGNALSTEKLNVTPLDLDFIYGRWKAPDLTLEPLDGQQRLTTLFLLHWYFASHDDAFDDFQSWIVHSRGGSCFTYHTRPAAREFFDALVQHPAPLGIFSTEPRPLSNWVTDTVWYVSSWKRDPTVRGCLTMLDAIHERFRASVGVWPRLISMEPPTIGFELLLLENFNLSDDLYIKMNARGKALTPFETLKAEVESFVGEEFGEEPCPHEAGINWRDYVSRQFDNAWTQFLWKQRRNTTNIDARFIHLIRALGIVRCVNRSDETILAAQVEQILATPEPSFQFLNVLRCVDRAFVEQLVSVLNTLSSRPEAPSFLGRADYMDEEALIWRVQLARGANQEDGLTLHDWVMFYAWCTFLLRFSADLENNQTRASFNDWIRVVRNLANNSPIDRSERLIAALRGLGQLSQHCGADFLLRVADGALEKSSGFNQQQQREERLKAQLILRNANWRPLIERAETHPYFRGDIEFLLRFSGLFERISQTQRCDWSDQEDSMLRGAFAEWYERACAIFPENTTAWPAPFPEFLWERALLATGDYLLPSGRNLSFLDDKDRDASWKRLLRADTLVPDREARRDVVRRVLERLDLKDVVGSLRTIVAAGVQGDDTIPVQGFRRRLVANPRLVEYCGLRMLRLEEDSVFLLTQRRRRGWHIDLYVYDLYFQFDVRRAELAPFDVQLIQTYEIHAPSKILMSTGSAGPMLQITKHGEEMQLHLEMPEPRPDVELRLLGWNMDGDNMRRFVQPDFAEEAIFDVVAAVKPFMSGRLGLGDVSGDPPDYIVKEST